MRTVDLEARFQRVLKRHRPRIRRIVARSCRGTLSAHVDDVEQEVILRLWKALKGERKIDNLSSYIYRIAATATIDALRRSRAEQERPMGEQGTSEVGQGVAAGPTPERAVEASDLLEKAGRTLRKLAANRQTAVGLYLQGFNPAEIADMTAWTEAKARNLVYRGLDELRRELKAEGIVYEAE